MRVRVLVDGVYNGPGHRSLGVCRAGDVIEVQGGAYADSLIADGFVEPYVEPKTVGVKDLVAAGKATKGKAKRSAPKKAATKGTATRGPGRPRKGATKEG